MKRSALLITLLALGANAERPVVSLDELNAQSLRATPDQVVMVHLSPGGKRVEHTVPFAFPRTRSFRFCISKDEPYIRTVTVLRDSSPAVVLKIPRGAPCLTRTLEAGFYRLVVEHDGSAVPPGGVRAFVHVPRLKQGVLTSEGTPSGFTCDPGVSDQVYTFTAPDGGYVNGSNGQAAHTAATPDRLFAPGGWKICPDGLGNYTVGHSDFTQTPAFFTASLGSDTRILVSSAVTAATASKFKVNDLGNGQFTLSWNLNGTLYPVALNLGDHTLHYSTVSSPSVFTIVVNSQAFYYANTTFPELRAGEVAFYQGCNYAPLYYRYVFSRDLPDLTPFVLFSTLDNDFDSLRVGPQTAAKIFVDAQYGGASQTATADVPCIGGALQNAVSSLEVIPERELVAASKQCQSCDLSGADLSGLDLSGGQFQSTNFARADLNGTNFQSANLSGAHLGGADTILTNTSFLGAVVRCTSFAEADLSTATFQLPQFGIKPVVTTDFSCRLDLTGATFGLSTFPLNEWRFMNLTGADVGLAGVTLSTLASPLDLSGAILDHHDLTGSTLDGANLGCATSGTGAPVCTQLTGVILNRASLRQANVSGAAMSGAQLNKANLDGADLSGAQLQSASLEWAYLRGGKLDGADLTGAFLKFVSFHGGSAAGATLDSSSFQGAYLAGTDFGGASAVRVNFSGAYLAGADFTGAELRGDVNTGVVANFSGAFLQGATFAQTEAEIANATFQSAYVNLAGGGTLLAQLSSDSTGFPGYTPSPGATPGCVAFAYAQATAVPTTGATNTCPNGGIGPCTPSQWTSPTVPPAALPASCSPGTVDQDF